MTFDYLHNAIMLRRSRFSDSRQNILLYLFAIATRSSILSSRYSVFFLLVRRWNTFEFLVFTRERQVRLKMRTCLRLGNFTQSHCGICGCAQGEVDLKSHKLPVFDDDRRVEAE